MVDSASHKYHSADDLTADALYITNIHMHHVMCCISGAGGAVLANVGCNVQYVPTTAHTLIARHQKSSNAIVKSNCDDIIIAHSRPCLLFDHSACPK